MREWKHVVDAGFLVPLAPETEVYGWPQMGFFIVVPNGDESCTIWSVLGGYADTRLLPNLPPEKTAEFLRSNAKPRYARDIWPNLYAAVDLLSPCCEARINTGLFDQKGECGKCGNVVVRKDLATGAWAWDDTESSPGKPRRICVAE